VRADVQAQAQSGEERARTDEPYSAVANLGDVEALALAGAAHLAGLQDLAPQLGQLGLAARQRHGER
jgi:hypothetical protein